MTKFTYYSTTIYIGVYKLSFYSEKAGNTVTGILAGDLHSHSNPLTFVCLGISLKVFVFLQYVCTLLTETNC